MNRVRTAGFTIIEVMLFLAVTGALTVGILASSQLAINEQRYRDTLTGVQSKLQQQYNQASHVINFRDDDSEIGDCDGNRGASNCVVVGRLVRVGQAELIITPLVARPSTDVSPVNGIPDSLEDSTPDDYDTEALFGLYSYYSAEELTETYAVPWSGEIEIEDDREVRILILRSPQTGLLHTYNAEANADDTVNYTTLIGSSSELKLCIPRGGLGNSRDLGVLVRANAASAAAVELTTDSTPCDS